MPRKVSSIAPDWWDYTTLDDDIIQAAARLTPEKMLKLSRAGFKVVFYDTLEEFYRKRLNTLTRGSNRPRTIRPASAGQSDRPSNCRWWRRW